MNQRYIKLVLILLLLAVVIWIDVPNSGIKIGSFQRSLDTVLGLDLRGGMQLLFEADVPETTTVAAQSLEDARQILENRSNGLGVSEVNLQIAGDRRIMAEIPGATDVQNVSKTIMSTGMLEFVDLGSTPMNPGTEIKTDYATGATADGTATNPTPAASANGEATPQATTEAEKVYHTVMTGADLKTVGVTTDQLGKYVVSFELNADGTKVFADHTTKNVGKYLAIVLDKKVISSPSIETPITEGKGSISGNFTSESANNLAVQLRYGSLPIPLKIVESKVIGPTLGQDSLNKSLLAGLIGFAVVILFMVIFYRLPGAVAIVSILIYAAITLALYKLIPVTLTLPGIAGLLLSTGGALDANILMIERLKEELRGGRNLSTALELAWKRAWPSIRDSNAATLITSAILFWFGSAFGASIVKGFALTLALGVIISIFCAFFISRTLLGVVSDWVKSNNTAKWFGA